MELDLSLRYEYRYMPGVAVRLTMWTDEDGFDHLVDDGGFVRVIMVGDDAVHTVDPDDLRTLDDLDYCAECGQIGCTHDGRERERKQRYEEMWT